MLVLEDGETLALGFVLDLREIDGAVSDDLAELIFGFQAIKQCAELPPVQVTVRKINAVLIEERCVDLACVHVVVVVSLGFPLGLLLGLFIIRLFCFLDLGFISAGVKPQNSINCRFCVIRDLFKKEVERIQGLLLPVHLGIEHQQLEHDAVSKTRPERKLPAIDRNSLRQGVNQDVRLIHASPRGAAHGSENTCR